MSLWLEATLLRVWELRLSLDDTRAACQLLQGLEFDRIPEPSVIRVEQFGREVASICWVRFLDSGTSRQVTAMPVMLNDRMRARLFCWGCPRGVESMPDQPVAVLRALLGWVYGEG